MADNLTFRDGLGTEFILATAEAGGVHTPKRALQAGVELVGYLDFSPPATLQRASISLSGSADHTLVAASPGQRCYLMGLKFVTLISVNPRTYQFKSASTALSGAMTLVTGQIITLPLSPVAWLRTGVNEALILTVTGSGAATVTGEILYCLL